MLIHLNYSTKKSIIVSRWQGPNKLESNSLFYLFQLTKAEYLHMFRYKQSKCYNTFSMQKYMWFMLKSKNNNYTFQTIYIIFFLYIKFVLISLISKEVLRNLKEK